MTAYATRHPLSPVAVAEYVVEVVITRRVTTVDGVAIGTAGHESPAAAAVAHIAALAAVHGHPLRARLTHQAAGTTVPVVIDPDGAWRVDPGGRP